MVLRSLSLRLPPFFQPSPTPCLPNEPVHVLVDNFSPLFQFLLKHVNSQVLSGSL